MSAKDRIQEADGYRRELDRQLAVGEREEDPAAEPDRLLRNAQICASLAIAEAVLKLVEVTTTISEVLHSTAPPRPPRADTGHP